MRYQLKRWWFWSGAFGLLGLLSAGIALTLIDGSRINQASFDRIQNGMTTIEVDRILGQSACVNGVMSFGCWDEAATTFGFSMWIDGPDSINVKLRDGKIYEKDMHQATTWERLVWHYRRIPMLGRLGF